MHRDQDGIDVLLNEAGAEILPRSPKYSSARSSQLLGDTDSKLLARRRSREGKEPPQLQPVDTTRNSLNNTGGIDDIISQYI